MAAWPGPSTTTPSTTVRLTLKANKLKDLDVFSKSDPMCVVFREFGRLKGPLEWREIGRTEIIWNNLNPEWATNISMEYFFEERQSLRFKIYDVDNQKCNLDSQDFLGQLDCDLAEIVSEETFTRKLTGLRGNCGTLSITSEELDEGARDSIQFDARAEKVDRKDFFGLGKSDPYLSIYRINDDRTKTLIHRTEFIRSTLNPNWKRFEIDKKTMCKGDGTRSILIECWDNDDDTSSSHDFIGSCTLTVDEMLAQPNGSFDLINEKKRAKKGKKYKNSGVLHLKTAVIRQFTFLDFIAGGTQLDFAVAVDFTASNGEVHRPDSLHFIRPGVPNQYEMAIRSVLEVCQFYNNSKRFDTFGFGAYLPPNKQMIPVFDLKNPQQYLGDPTVVGIDGVLQAYRHSLNKVQLYGPTNFAPVISEVATRASANIRNPGARYQILLIITDGAICDMAKTKRAIIEAASMPFSIIIVGVGGADFEKMDELDGDDARIQADGRFAERDIVQFVPMRDFMPTRNASSLEHDRIMGLLAKEVLAEVPLQLTSYMKSRGIAARPATDPFPKDPCAIPQYGASAPPSDYPLDSSTMQQSANNFMPPYPVPGQPAQAGAFQPAYNPASAPPVSHDDLQFNVTQGLSHIKV